MNKPHTASSDQKTPPSAKPAPPARKKKVWKILGVLVIIFLVFTILAGIAGFATAYFVYQKYSADLPDVKELRNYKPSLPTVIYSDSDDKIGEFYIERRILVPLEKIPSMMINASIAVEDSHFFTHRGIDFQGILRAAIKNFMAGRVVEGGSTITQQLAKTMFLSPLKKLERKIREAILAVNIEKNFTKNEIMEIYLNQIYYGHGAYGVEAAAQVYFGKHIHELDTSEIALLAALPRAPSNYSPYLNPERAMKRRSHVLRRLLLTNFITEKEAEEAMSKPFHLGDREASKENKAPYFMEYIRRYVEEEYGSKKLYRSGFNVYTTLNLEYQEEARKAMFNGLRTNDKRYGYRGPLYRPGSPEESMGTLKTYSIGEVIPFPWEPENSQEDFSIVPERILVGSVTKVNPQNVEVSLGALSGEISLKNMDWARKPNKRLDSRYHKIDHPGQALKEGDVIEVRVLPPQEGQKDDAGGTLHLALEQEPEVEGALLAVEPVTGLIKAMVGGYDFKKSQFNRATQAKRQPGSAFKPIIYSAAIEKNYTPATVILDSPVIFNGAEGKVLKWKPENFEEKFFGPTRLRSAIAHSRNLVTIKILHDIGLSSVIEFAERLGIKSPLSKDLSLALGSSGMTLMELTSAYGVFASKGIAIKPAGIRKIINRDGAIVEEHKVEEKQIISPETAYLTASILKSVVEEGTGAKVAVLGRPIAAKTGTTNDYIDAWFMGFTAELVTGVWVGLDKNEPLGINETGSYAAAPIWLDFMSAALKDKPVYDFTVPQGIVFKKIDEKTGLLAPFGKPFLFECFSLNTAPVQFTPTDSEGDDFPGLDS